MKTDSYSKGFGSYVLRRRNEEGPGLQAGGNGRVLSAFKNKLKGSDELCLFLKENVPQIGKCRET